MTPEELWAPPKWNDSRTLRTTSVRLNQQDAAVLSQVRTWLETIASHGHREDLARLRNLQGTTTAYGGPVTDSQAIRFALRLAYEKLSAGEA